MRENRPSGIRGGLTETWTMVELGTRSSDRKRGGRKLSTHGSMRRVSTRRLKVANSHN